MRRRSQAPFGVHAKVHVGDRGGVREGKTEDVERNETVGGGKEVGKPRFVARKPGACPTDRVGRADPAEGEARQQTRAQGRGREMKGARRVKAKRGGQKREPQGTLLERLLFHRGHANAGEQIRKETAARPLGRNAQEPGDGAREKEGVENDLPEEDEKECGRQKVHDGALRREAVGENAEQVGGEDQYAREEPRRERRHAGGLEGASAQHELGTGEGPVLRVFPRDEGGVGGGRRLGTVDLFGSAGGDQYARFFGRHGKTNGFLHDASPKALRMTALSGVSQW